MFFACTAVSMGQETQNFDTIPENARIAFLELYGGNYSAYTAYIDGPQPFVLPDGEPYIPLTLALYLVGDHTEMPNTPLRDLDFFLSGPRNLKIFQTESGQDKIIVGNAQYNMVEDAHYNVEAYWLENDVYLPAITFLNSLDINVIWDSVTRVLTVPEAYPLKTTQYYYAQDGFVSVDGYPVFGNYTNVLLPNNVSTTTDERGYEFLNISVSSLVDVPIGVNVLHNSGGQLIAGQSFESCMFDTCSVEYFLGNFKNRNDSRIILFEILVLNSDQ